MAASIFRFARLVEHWSLVKRFTIFSLMIMILGVYAIGWWIGEQIRIGVIRESANTAALYMDSFIAPNVQEMGYSETLTSEHSRTLNSLFSENDLGRRTVTIKIWSK